MYRYSHMSDWAGRVITDGTDRSGRISPALQPDYFNVDELVFEQLLAMGTEFAAKVNYVNLRNKADGSWAELLSADEAVIMAMILSTNLEQLEARFLSLLSMRPSWAADYILQTAKRMNFWIYKLDRNGQDAGDALGYKLNGLVEETLAQELHTVAGIAHLLSSSSSSLDSNEAPLNFNFSEFTAVWGIKKAEESFLFPLAQVSVMGSVNDIKRQLRSAFYVFFNAMSHMKTITPSYLTESLGSQVHEPAVSLFVVFLKLYEKAQKTINQFTQRHLDFYYHRVLQAKPKKSLPESAHLLLDIQPGMQGVLIEKGRPFSAGAGKNVDEIIYCADSDLWMTDVRVAALHTLYLQRDNLIAPESELGYVTRIKESRLSLPAPGETAAKAWPLFGEEKRGAEKPVSKDAEIGFSIATPLLLLDEGERRVELSIIFDKRDGNDADALTAELCQPNNEQPPCEKEIFFKQFGALFSRYLLSPEGWLSRENKDSIVGKAAELLEGSIADDIAHLLAQDWQGLFYQLLENIFCIQLTTQEGWLDVDDYVVTPYVDGSNNALGLNIEFDLGQELDAVVSYSPGVHGENLDTVHPLLKCCINAQSSFYPYSLFSDLAVKAVDLKVSAKGVKNLQLYNNHGQLDPSKPFMPFGPLPGSNAYLVFGNYELAKKRLLALTLNLEWGELPSECGGFSKHYAAYETNYRNNGFKASFETLADGHWLPREREVEHNVSLFDSQGEGEIKADRSVAVNVLEHAKPMAAGIGKDDYQYNVASRNGFFKLSLRAPQSAFGHAEYPELLSQVLMQNVKIKIPRPTPNAPYTPTLNRVSLDYSAHGRISSTTHDNQEQPLHAEKIFHHHPFGVNKVSPSSGGQAPRLFPQFEHRGNLFIGLLAKELRGSVTLFFHLSEDHGQEVITEASQFSWFYLAKERWKRLPATRIIRDTTNGFLSSGVVTLNIPSEIDKGGHEMPGDLYWLRLSSEKEVQGRCSCFSVHCNAVPVTRQLQAGVEQQEVASNEAKWQPMVSIPGIGKVSQIGSLFSGRSQENELDFKTRVSEQLRHKNRASTPWDYERLVLDNFPSVAKVKCFANMRSDWNRPAPGHVLVVVVPQVDTASVSASSRAMVSSVELSRIRTFLLRHTASCVKLEVRNPDYEQVQIRCTVKFSTSLGDGAWGNRLDRDISEYLSPWRLTGYISRFGWAIRQKDIESYIRELEYIEFVTNFSMLHLTMNSSGDHFLGDTAREQQASEMIIRPRNPWSLVTPADHHFIETTQVISGVKAEITGVNELEIGSTFIISGSNEHG